MVVFQKAILKIKKKKQVKIIEETINKKGKLGSLSLEFVIVSSQAKQIRQKILIISRSAVFFLAKFRKKSCC